MISRKIQNNLIKAWSEKKEQLTHLISTHHPQLWTGRKHLKEGTDERAYYLYGYYSALNEVVTALQKKENENR